TVRLRPSCAGTRRGRSSWCGGGSLPDWYSEFGFRPSLAPRVQLPALLEERQRKRYEALLRIVIIPPAVTELIFESSCHRGKFIITPMDVGLLKPGLSLKLCFALTFPGAELAAFLK